MNQAANLKGFMRMLGVPFRPYKDIMEEISSFIQSKQETKQQKDSKLVIQGLNDIIINLKAQLIENKIKPNENFININQKKVIMLAKMRESLNKKFDFANEPHLQVNQNSNVIDTKEITPSPMSVIDEEIRKKYSPYH